MCSEEEKGNTIRVAVFSTKPYDRMFLESANENHGHNLVYLEARLDDSTVTLADGFDAVCVFVNDELPESVVATLARQGTRLIALRAAGFNNVDLAAAQREGIVVARVPAYSPHAVAEHTVALMLALNRKIPRAANRVRDGNFALNGLLGFDMVGRTVGIVGTGNIGAVVARIMTGFGCVVLAHDPYPNDECLQLGVRYVDLDEVFRESDIITLHCPLMPATHHLVNERSLNLMRQGVMLINTSRGALLDTPAVIEALKTGKIGYLGLDVYEEEGDLFFQDLSGIVIKDDVFARLQTFPNVLITGHQAFFTREALQTIAETTVSNITAFERGGPVPNTVTAEAFVR